MTLPFSKQEFTQRLLSETDSLLDLVVKTEDKDESSRLYEKREAVEDALAHWFGNTVDMDDTSAKAWLTQLAGFIRLKLESPATPSDAKKEGYNLVLSYIEEY